MVNSRALGFQIERFYSVQDCVDQCATKGFLYAGLQNGDLCFCGNDFDKYGRADDLECNIKCRKPDEDVTITNNPFDSCGGRWRNSVYAGKYEYTKKRYKSYRLAGRKIIQKMSQSGDYVKQQIADFSVLFIRA